MLFLLSDLFSFAFSFELFSISFIGREHELQKKLGVHVILKLSKREVIKKVSIDELGVDLEHLCSYLWKQCKSSHGSFSAKNMCLLCFIPLYHKNKLPS